MTDPDEQDRPTFADLGIDKRVLKALDDVGYESPSPIQAAMRGFLTNRRATLAPYFAPPPPPPPPPPAP